MKVLSVEVWDNGMFKDDLVGKNPNVSLDPLLQRQGGPRQGDLWVDFFHKDNKPAGRIHLAMSFTPDAPAPRPPSEKGSARATVDGCPCACSIALLVFTSGQDFANDFAGTGECRQQRPLELRAEWAGYRNVERDDFYWRLHCQKLSRQEPLTYQHIGSPQHVDAEVHITWVTPRSGVGELARSKSRPTRVRRILEFSGLVHARNVPVAFCC